MSRTKIFTFNLLCLALWAIAVPFAHAQLPVLTRCQTTLPWGGMALGSGPPADTLAKYGCGVTCLSMIHQYYGVSTDPGVMNQWLKDNHAFAAYGDPYHKDPSVEYLTWGPKTAVQGVSYKGSITKPSSSAIKAELDAGFPVIAETVFPGRGQHFVVITGYSGSNYFINDPADGKSNKTYSPSYDLANLKTIYEYRGVADGLYAPANESGIFLVVGGTRRAFLSAASFVHWEGNSGWNNIHSVSQSAIYRGTSWQPPIPDLITASGRGINWIENGTARPISSSDVFNAMGFLWSDYRNVSQAEFDSFPCTVPALRLNAVEPRLIVTDGPFVNKNTGSQSGGFRIRNLSQSSMPFDVTVRVYRSDGWWQDFPWQKNVTLGQNKEDVWWSNNSLPSGHYTFSVLYSYWANGMNMQFVAPVAGITPYSTQQGMFVLP